MSFSFVETIFEGENNSCGDGDWFEFGPGGILAVHYAREKNRDSRYFASWAWRDLRTDQPPGPLTEAAPRWGFHNARD